MPHHPLAAIICALLAALLFAVAAVAQQHAAAAVPEGDSLIRALLRNPRWWAGILGDAGGFAMQVVALALGAVLLVQPILVSMLVFALPLSARLNKRTVTARTWATAIALVAALACFLIVGDPSEGNANAPLHEWIVPLAILLGLIAAAIAIGAATAAPALRAMLLGTAGGALFGLAAALTEYVTTLFEHGLGQVLGSWQTWALVAASLIGFYLQQRAFQAGPLVASLPAICITEPLAAAYVGITVLDERLRTGTIGLVVIGCTVIVMCATTIQLSRAQAEA
ncbi:DMT family transporter [Nocardia sp. NBC_01009]|uniref:DMT family transporter n=1 Tax=Nocardia sp. NBC_01009 TaxID=2975996 RepID=UPI0038699C7D|nr:DMT family transporter [Nocardia sp. NBC_01009]